MKDDNYGPTLKQKRMPRKHSTREKTKTTTNSQLSEKQKSNALTRRGSSSSLPLHKSPKRKSTRNSIESTIACANKSESILQAQLTGLWTGECLDSNSNVIQITDAVLRFFVDSETGQSTIEGRSKSASEQLAQGSLVPRCI